MRRTILILWLTLAIAAVGCGGSDDAEKVFRFTALPHSDTTALKRKFEPVAEYLSEKLGVKVEYVPATDYDSSLQMFKNGDVQMAWFGGLTGVQARHAIDGARAIVMGDADKAFKSYFIAHRDTGLTRSDEFPAAIADLKFTFGSAKSTSGRLMPEFFIMEHSGKTAAEFFTQTPGFSGKHDLTAKAVENGSYQAGVMNYGTYETMVRRGELDPDACRVIWETPTYADYNITIHPAVSEMFGEEFVGKVRSALVEMSDRKLLAAFERDKLIPASDEDFAGIVGVAKKLDLLR